MSFAATQAAAADEVGRVRGIGADARDGGELHQLRENPVVPGFETREHPRQIASLAAVDREHLARDPAGMVRREEQHARRNVLHRAQAPQRDPFDERPLSLGAVRCPLRLGGRIRAHEPGRHVVDRDAPRSQLVGQLPGETDLRRLGRRVGLDPGETDAEPGPARDVDDAPEALAAFMPGATA